MCSKDVRRQGARQREAEGGRDTQTQRRRQGDTSQVKSMQERWWWWWCRRRLSLLVKIEGDPLNMRHAQHRPVEAMEERGFEAASGWKEEFVMHGSNSNGIW